MPDAPPGVRAGVEIAIGVVRDARRARRGIGSGELTHERAWVMCSRIHLVTQAPLTLVGMLPPLCYLPSRLREPSAEAKQQAPGGGLTRGLPPPAAHPEGR